MSFINTLCWMIATVMLISSGLFYTFKLHFTQFNFKKMFYSMKKSKGNDGISPFKTLTLALAARIGVGSLAGIALGIYNGGIGVIFWIWISSLIILPNSFVESALAVMFHEKDGKYYKGGPAYYINKGLGFKKLSTLYAIIITICYLGGFLAIQSNTIAVSLKNYVNIPLIVSGIVVAIISYLIISKGLKRIANFTSFLVPIMGILYMFVAIIILFINIDKIPILFSEIIKDAFNIKAVGWGIISSIIIGVQRGVFSSEAGIGTGAVASGTSDTNNPLKQGYVQMLGVYFTSFIICTSTSFIILTSNIDIKSFSSPNGIEITLSALNYHLGNIGTIVLVLAILFFAFSTIVSGYYYGESNLSFLNDGFVKKRALFINVSITIILLIGAILPPTNLWNIVDIGVAILAIINSMAMLLLRKKVLNEFKKGSY